MKAPDKSVLNKASFAVYYDKKGMPVHVEGPDGPVEGVPMADSPVHSIEKFDTTLIGHKSADNVCCIIIQGELYCWC